jgi:hypothetical protein
MKLENKFLRISFDGNGRLISFENKALGQGNIISSPTDDCFMMTLANDRCKEILVFGHEQTVVESSFSEDTAIFKFDRLKIDNGRNDAGYAEISVNLYVKLEDDNVIFTADIDNRTDLLITDFEYPRIGSIKSLGDGKPTLFWPEQPGRLYMNIGERLSNYPRIRENGSNSMKITYPGMAMMGMCALLDNSNSLFLKIKDPNFLASEIKVCGDHKDFGAITLVIDKNLCVKKGQFSTAPIFLQFYSGSWHRGAEEYAKWINSYRPKHKIPDWIKEMTGYFLVINKQQFGYEMWDYTTLPKLYELAKAHGCDTVGLFGWYDSGHDNNYPDLEVSESMGGEDELKRGIREIQAMGGHVTLYYQGHLIDLGSDYYKSGKGKQVACKTIWGENYAEYYSKSHKSDFLANYSRKMFAIACPSCPEWRELMTEREKWIASLGADGALYDQIGGMPPYICFDESHPHDGGNPARALPGGQVKLVSELQLVSKNIGENFAFMSEHITDLYSAYLDAVHGISVQPGGRGERINKIGGNTGVVTFPDVFRYCFPETVITLRNPNPFIDRRSVNFAYVFGFPYEMELRYRADKEDILADTFADMRIYAEKISRFRRKYKDYLAHGTYRDNIDIINSNVKLFCKGYESDSGFAVVIWNDSDEAILPNISVTGRELVLFDTPDGSENDRLVTIAPDSIAIAIYK